MYKGNSNKISTNIITPSTSTPPPCRHAMPTSAAGFLLHTRQGKASYIYIYLHHPEIDE